MNPQRDTFSALHADGTFIMPNPWDRGSARILAEAGFPALATTSAGHARSIGKDDQELTRDELEAHVADLTSFLAEAFETTIPLNVDAERLYPDDPGGIAQTARMLADAGAAGCSIEDYDPATGTIDDIATASGAVAAAATACATSGMVLTARAENHLYRRGGPDGAADPEVLADTIARLRAYQEAGADVLYAPGLRMAGDIALVLEAIDRPLNVLASPDGPSVPELQALGVRRVSIGSAMYNAAASSLRLAATELLDHGTSLYAQ